MNYPTLNFPSIQLRARRGVGGRTEVYDKVRAKWLVLTPEEWVRQHVVDFMLTQCGFLPQQIVEEYPVGINGMSQRADIVALDCDARPYVIVECKEPGVKICDDVLRQVVRYNSILGCEYIVITNGITTYGYHREGNSYTPIDAFPHQRA